MVESLGEVTRAVEEILPKLQWICLEGDDTDPIKSLASHLNTKWSHLERLLGVVKRPKCAIQDVGYTKKMDLICNACLASILLLRFL